MPPPAPQSAAELPSHARYGVRAVERCIETQGLMAKPCTPQPIAQRVQLFKCQSRNVSLSLGDKKGVFSFAKENTPFAPCSAIGAALPCPSAKIKKHHNLRCDALWSGRRGSLAALPCRDTHSGRQTPHRGVFSLRSRPVRPSARFVSKK